MEEYRTGQSIGPYRLVRKLGEGGFGEVWEVEDGRSQERFAAKILEPDTDEDADAYFNTCLAEVQAWSAARGSRHIHRLIRPEKHGSRLLLLSEVAPNGSLKSWLRRHGGKAPSVGEAVTMMLGVLSGLEELHRSEPPILHRDLKPANVLLFGSEPRLSDFGLSRSTSRSSYVKLSQSVATWEYAGPEVYDDVYRRQTDLWSAGVMLFEMLTGRLPFPYPPGPALMKAVLSGEAQELPGSVPAPIRKVVDRALAKDWRQRFQTASEMRVALEAAIAPQPTPRPAPPAAPAPKPQPAPPKASPSTPDPARSQHPPGPKPAPPVERSDRGYGRRTLLLGALGTAAAAGGWWWTHRPSGGGADPDPRSPNRLSTRPRNPAPGTVWPNPVDGAEMVYIPGGKWQLGDVDSLEGRNPVHTVTLSGYWMYRYPVTVAQFRKFTEDRSRNGGFTYDWNGRKPRWGWIDDHPMVRVSWEDASAYCKWAGVSLPSESQWEHAARGPKGWKYPWGNDWDGSKCCNSVKPNDAKSTAKVGSYPANAYGLYDMAGNVWEWCADWYDAAFWKNSANLSNIDPVNRNSNDRRVLRGGSWYFSYPVYFRASFRYYLGPANWNYFSGFRGCSQD